MAAMLRSGPASCITSIEVVYRWIYCEKRRVLLVSNDMQPQSNYKFSLELPNGGVNLSFHSFRIHCIGPVPFDFCRLST